MKTLSKLGALTVDLQRLFWLHVTWCAQLYSLAETSQLPPSPRIWTRITRALLVIQDRRHLFVTPCCHLSTLYYIKLSQYWIQKEDERGPLGIQSSLVYNLYPCKTGLSVRPSVFCKSWLDIGCQRYCSNSDGTIKQYNCALPVNGRYAHVQNFLIEMLMV